MECIVEQEAVSGENFFSGPDSCDMVSLCVRDRVEKYTPFRFDGEGECIGVLLVMREARDAGEKDGLDRGSLKEAMDEAGGVGDEGVAEECKEELEWKGGLGEGVGLI